MKRDLFYMRKTLKELIILYDYENCDADNEDAKITKESIVNEVHERINKVFRVLNNNDNVNIDSLYAELIQPAKKVEY